MAAIIDLAELNEKVLARFAEELSTAGADQLEHLARRAEMLTCTDLGQRMRDLVTGERDRRSPGLSSSLLDIAEDGSR